MFRLSNYTFPIEFNGEHYIFSSRNGVLLRISDKLWTLLKNRHYLDEDLIMHNPVLQTLKEKQILCTEKDDSTYLNKLHVEHLSHSFQTSHLSLTILPTERCNLACSYCFEVDKQQIDMSNDVQIELFNYLRSTSCRTYSITWFGGEPLLRIDVIKNLLDELSKIRDKKMTHHTLITNGTLLSPKVYEVFKRYPLDEIQITFDGIKETHDSIRCHSNGIGTFDKIREGIIRFAEIFPKTKINFRINIGNNNRHEFKQLYKTIKSWFSCMSEIRYNIYPGIIKDKGAKSCASACMNKCEELNFYLDLKSSGIKYFGYPQKKTCGCIATCTSSAVIGADGNIYRCWEEVGKKELVISNLHEQLISNSDLYSNYLIQGSIFNDPTCRECSFLPLCSGGCPRERIKSENSDRTSLCSLYKINEGILLETIIKDEISKKLAN